MNKENFQVISKLYFSNFITYEIPPGTYSIKDFSEVVYTMGDHDGTLQIEYDDISMKTKPILKRFGGSFGTLRFDEKSFFQTLSNYPPPPQWNNKPTNEIHADFLDVFTSEIVMKLSTKDKIHLKCDVIDGSVLNGSRLPVLYTVPF